MQFKGTKGSWSYEQDKEYPTLHNIWSDADNKILRNGILIGRTCYAPRSKANAQLIAHAPELLEMINELYQLLEENQGEAKFYTRGHHKRITDLLTRATTI